MLLLLMYQSIPRAPTPPPFLNRAKPRTFEFLKKNNCQILYYMGELHNEMPHSQDTEKLSNSPFPSECQ